MTDVQGGCIRKTWHGSLVSDDDDTFYFDMQVLDTDIWGVNFDLVIFASDAE
jgi:hypothetical protein